MNTPQIVERSRVGRYWNASISIELPRVTMTVALIRALPHCCRATSASAEPESTSLDPSPRRASSAARSETSPLRSASSSRW